MMKAIFPESSSPSLDFCSSKLSGSDNTSTSAASCSKLSDGDVVDKRGEANDVSNRSSVSVCGAFEGKESSSRGYCTSKPHQGNDLKWECVQHVVASEGELGFSNFRLVKKLGFGDIGSVYLAELRGTGCVFAMKVMDRSMLVSRKKVERAKTERDILASLDHPFLPTLYSHFETDKFSCFLMEFCCGGDLHLLRQLQPEKRFSEKAVRFYAAEVLLGLEYLHMMGVIYRDLKPENVLIREDGHIMLSDFDLSLKCTVNPTLISSKPCDSPSCQLPVCAEPSCFQPTCFKPRFFNTRKENRGSAPRSSPASPYLLVAEPTGARSNSFVGTHEYLAPEIIRGDGHGSAVDWWTFGVFIYELLHGKTPFKGSKGDRETLFNVVGQKVSFPNGAQTSSSAKDLIGRLLVKEPQKRMGFRKGAAEIKKHPFFEGVNWALIRSATPPVIPAPYDLASENETWKTPSGNVESMRSSTSYLELEFF